MKDVRRGLLKLSPWKGTCDDWPIQQLVLLSWKSKVQETHVSQKGVDCLDGRAERHFPQGSGKDCPERAVLLWPWLHSSLAAGCGCRAQRKQLAPFLQIRGHFGQDHSSWQLDLFLCTVGSCVNQIPLPWEVMTLCGVNQYMSCKSGFEISMSLMCVQMGNFIM